MAGTLLVLFVLQDLLLAFLCDRIARFVAVSAKAIEGKSSEQIDEIGRHVGSEWEKQK